MKKVKVESYRGFKDAMMTAARGDAVDDYRDTLVVPNIAALLRLLTPENRELLRVIRDEHPDSVAALARRIDRAEPNVAKSLAKLEAIGLVAFRIDGRRKIPIAQIGKLHVEIDPFAQSDRIVALDLGS